MTTRNKMKGFIYLDALIGAPAHILFAATHPNESQYEHLVHTKQWDTIRSGVFPEMTPSFQRIVSQRDPTLEETHMEQFRVRPVQYAFRTQNVPWITAISGSFLLMCAKARGPIGTALLFYNAGRFSFASGGYKSNK